MKKILCAALAAFLLLASGCQATEDPAPTPPSSAPAPDSVPSPAMSDAAPSPSAPQQAEPLTELPGFVTDFQIDQIRLDHTSADDGDYYLDYAVYLLDETQQAAYREALAPESWTDVTDFPAVSFYRYSASYDLAGNRVDAVPWDEERCLINCFPTDGSVHRYWAPSSVLDDVQAFIEGLAPLGYIDYTAKEYHELFRSDFGFDCMMEIDNSDGSISDDQMAAYVIETMAYAGLYDYDTGISTEEFDEITKKHFGKTIQNFENSKSKYVEAGGRVTATGWDVPFTVHPVLDGEPQEDENGVITARFLCYTLWERLWLDGEFDPFKLEHAGEYLLTGNTGGFPEPQTAEIVFEIQYAPNEYGYSTPYVVYHSIKVIA